MMNFDIIFGLIAKLIFTRRIILQVMIEIKSIYQDSLAGWHVHSIPLIKNPAGRNPRGSAGAWL